MEGDGMGSMSEVMCGLAVIYVFVRRGMYVYI